MDVSDVFRTDAASQMTFAVCLIVVYIRCYKRTRKLHLVTHNYLCVVTKTWERSQGGGIYFTTNAVYSHIQ